MSRLTNKTYLKQRTRIRHLWFDLDGFAISYLSPREQMDLHALYAPTEVFAADVALAYRKGASREERELPHRAGRAYARLLALEAIRASAAPSVTGNIASRAYPTLPCF